MSLINNRLSLFVQDCTAQFAETSDLSKLVTLILIRISVNLSKNCYINRSFHDSRKIPIMVDRINVYNNKLISY